MTEVEDSLCIDVEFIEKLNARVIELDDSYHRFKRKISEGHNEMIECVSYLQQKFEDQQGILVSQQDMLASQQEMLESLQMTLNTVAQELSARDKEQTRVQYQRIRTSIPCRRRRSMDGPVDLTPYLPSKIPRPSRCR
ncbi:hypothetical protein DIURU_000937 [Diutina rugosa]|uniref:Uncharacterized protein n=1 Tax=Diutina rugosa TaxID=5481 RepID=A0A642UY31_DIURU|nr:uncharacterized protein DIURU_000937 [Diutina rugosa]KAA8906776.1 hypothetical protein DIURU_000937 [Diutina rugosa]